MSHTIEQRAAAAMDNALPGMQLDALVQAGMLVTDAKALRTFLDHCGQASKCAGCGADIWWFTARNGKRWPVTAAGMNHFADCEKGEMFRRDRG